MSKLIFDLIWFLKLLFSIWNNCLILILELLKISIIFNLIQMTHSSLIPLFIALNPEIKLIQSSK